MTSDPLTCPAVLVVRGRLTAGAVDWRGHLHPEGGAVTEAEWLACADPGPMLESLRGRVSERKLRLFACACVRRVWHLLSDERSRGAVEVAERYADGAADLAALEAGQAAADDQGGASATCTPPAPRCRCGAEMVLRQGPRDLFFGCATYPRCRGVRPSLYTAAGAAARAAASAVDPSGSAGWRAAHDAERGQQCRLLRDLFGPLPFRAVRIDPTWLVWNGGTVKRLAEGIYDERTFDRLPVLADALEEAGCTDLDLLNHLRGPGPHVRGCWALDLLLGKA